MGVLPNFLLMINGQGSDTVWDIPSFYHRTKRIYEEGGSRAQAAHDRQNKQQSLPDPVIMESLGMESQRPHHVYEDFLECVCFRSTHLS